MKPIPEMDEFREMAADIIDEVTEAITAGVSGPQTKERVPGRVPRCSYPVWKVVLQS